MKPHLSPIRAAVPYVVGEIDLTEFIHRSYHSDHLD